MGILAKKIAYVTKSLELIKANKEFLTYFESPTLRCNNLIDFVIEEEQEFLKALIKTGPEEKKFYHFKLRKNSGEYKNNVVNIVPSVEKGQDCFVVVTFDVEELLHFNFQNSTDEIRLRSALSITDEFLFYYDDTTKKIKIFQFFQNQKVTLYNQDIDEWKMDMISRNLIDSNSLSAFEAFVKDIKEIPGSLTAKLKCGIRSGSDTLLETLKFVGVAINDEGAQLNEFVTDIVDSPNRFIVDDKFKMGNFIVGRIVPETVLNQSKQENMLLNQLQLDPLTEIYNKKAIEDFARARVHDSKNEPVALIIVDLDHFKPVNDLYGHKAGDQVLVKAASIFKEIVGDDGFVGRFGGDEFVFVVNGLNSEPILRGFLRAILTNVSIAFSDTFEDIKITCSIGCAISPNNTTDYDELFRMADYCLLRAKNKGRDRYIFFREDLHRAEYEQQNQTKNSGAKVEVREMVELRYMSQFMNELEESPHSAFANLFNHMIESYNLDTISFYSGSDLHLSYNVGGMLPGQDEAKFALTDEFKQLLDNENHVQIDFMSDLKETQHNIKKEFFFRGIKSTYICLLGSPDNVQGVVMFNRSKFQQRFAEYEVNCIKMVATVLGLNYGKMFTTLCAD